MSEEEKKAIEKLKEAQDRMTRPRMLKHVKYNNEDYAEAIDTILYLVKKQQKEIKELNIKDKMHKVLFIDPINKQLRETLYIRKDTLDTDYISKDKLRKKLEQFRIIKREIFKIEHELGTPSITYDIVRNDYCEKILEDLLEEKQNDRFIK